MKYIPSFLLFLCFGLSGNAQTLNTVGHYLPIGVGLSFFQSKDSYNSPHRYKGVSTKFLVGYESFSEEKIHRENFIFQNGELKNGTPNDKKKSFSQFVYRGDYATRNQPVNIVPSESENQINYFFGVSLKVNFSNRSKGRFFQFDGSATLNLTASATYNFYDFQNRGDNWFYDGAVNLPLVGVGFRPRYAAHAYEGDVSNFQKNTISFIYFPKHFDLDAILNANWNMGNGNILRGSYRWWYYDSRLMHRTRMLENGVNFSLLTKLN